MVFLSVFCSDLNFVSCINRMIRDIAEFSINVINQCFLCNLDMIAIFIYV